MISLQLLNRVIQTKNPSLIAENNLTEQHFLGYEKEYLFVQNHIERYGTPPDVETVLANFKEFDVIQVRETDEYLSRSIKEQYLYQKLVGALQATANILKDDSYKALEHITNEIGQLMALGESKAVDLVTDANLRLQEYLEDKSQQFIPTGFDELDEVLGGWSRKEEFGVLFARTGHGKSWVLLKTLQAAWLEGYTVGMISPEMSANKVGYRFDSLACGFSNRALMRGEEQDGYEGYIEELQANSNSFIVATGADFGNRITITKLKHFIRANKIDILGIDGLSYIHDERKGDTRALALTNISEGLMGLSLSENLPILGVVQANRGAAKNAPEVENIRDSDGISHNATKILTLWQDDRGLTIRVLKNRDGKSQEEFHYVWDIDTGTFESAIIEDD